MQSLAKCGGDVVVRHNHLHDIFANFCHCAHLSVTVEVGCGLSRDHINPCPACLGLGRGFLVCPSITILKQK